MRNLLLLLASLLLTTTQGCGDKEAAQKEDSNESTTTPAPDAAEAAEVPIAKQEPPLTGTHLDSTSTEYQPRPGWQSQSARGKRIQLVLRSSPPGAVASIDGKSIGTTPSFWSGPADDQSHEYTFTKEGYAMARYRFVATQSGVVHGTLKPLVKHGTPTPQKP